MAVSGNARFPSYLAPCVSCSKDHLSRGSCSIHYSKVLIDLPSLLLVLGGSKPGRSHSPTASSSTAAVPVANCAATASTCALTAASLAAFLSLTCLCVHTLSLSRIKLYFYNWFCLQSFLNRFIRFLFPNCEKKLAPRWRMHQRLCKSCHGTCSSGPGFVSVLIALSIPACLS